MNIATITRIEHGTLYFAEGESEHAISLRTSANAFFDAFYRLRIWDRLIGTRRKNTYVGIREFVTNGTATITLFDEKYKYEFEMEVNSENVVKCRDRWSEINLALNREGFWLLDMD